MYMYRFNKRTSMVAIELFCSAKDFSKSSDSLTIELSTIWRSYWIVTHAESVAQAFHSVVLQFITSQADILAFEIKSKTNREIVAVRGALIPFWPMNFLQSVCT